MLPRVHIDLIFNVGDARRDGLCPDPNKIRSSMKQRLLVHPNYVCCELLRDLWSRGRRDEDIAAGNVELIGEGEGDRISTFRGFNGPVISHDFAGRETIVPNWRRRSRLLAGFGRMPRFPHSRGNPDWVG